MCSGPGGCAVGKSLADDEQYGLLVMKFGE